MITVKIPYIEFEDSLLSYLANLEQFLKYYMTFFQEKHQG